MYAQALRLKTIPGKTREIGDLRSLAHDFVSCSFKNQPRRTGE